MQESFSCAIGVYHRLADKNINIFLFAYGFTNNYCRNRVLNRYRTKLVVIPNYHLNVPMERLKGSHF